MDAEAGLAAVCVRAFFMLASATVLLVHFVPAFRLRFLSYGSRAESRDRKSDDSCTRDGDNPPSSALFLPILDRIAAFRVPHSWFAHFYLFSVFSSLFWGYQIISDGFFFHNISRLSRKSANPGMSVERVVSSWSLMLLQGLRRSYESKVLAKPSQSKMWIVHWALGLSFYAFMGVAVWVEGIPSLATSNGQPSGTLRVSSTSRAAQAVIGVALFFAASSIQHTAHRYLYHLPSPPRTRDYTFPEHPYFRYTVTPHYAAECLLYLAVSMVAAPENAWVNRTVFAGFIFVVVNLGVTAKGTREWYADRFGQSKVASRWRMIPFVW
ncbi:hypothetical protein K402DRAFT_381942 [Aulographum hederae CBS 113979]|uniref:Polyprenal reductase n=1 Tax=Aulographum hederae CBS 113979 TaxID=1176131 RepID=A0A6G1GSP4_9PEZI|nr:hypothetical protein K402DRAFT_381942 [Aulographum hederae CBS 113979]